MYIAADDGLYTMLKIRNKLVDEAKILNNIDQKNSILEDDDGKIWLGNSFGIFRISFKKMSKAK